MGRLVIDRLVPNTGWPGGERPDGTRVPGTSVIIEGSGFYAGAQRQRNQVTFAGSDGARLATDVQWVTPTESNYHAGSVIEGSAVPGGFSSPAGITVDRQGVLFVADTKHHRVVRITPNGGITSWGGFGSAPGTFNQPTGIAADEDGNVYVADTLNHRIQKFDNQGGLIGLWGGYGSNPGQFDMPVAIDVSTIGGVPPTMVWVADSNNKRIVRTDSAGNYQQSYSPPAILHGPTAGRMLGVSAPRNHGYVFASDPSNHRILRWAWTGPFNGSYGPPGDPSNLQEVQFDFPMGLDQDADGFLYVVDQGARVIRKFDTTYPNLAEIAQFGLTIPPIGGPTPKNEFVDPVDVAVTGLKAAFGLDRQRGQIVEYVTDDSQKLVVNVPEGAVDGLLQVSVDGAVASAPFSIWQRGPVEISKSYLTQGLVEYPGVAGKRTLIRFVMRTGSTVQSLQYNWGAPGSDSAICRVLGADGTLRGVVEGEGCFIAMSGGTGMMRFAEGFEIRFHIPLELVTAETLTFDVQLDRSGTPGFHHSQSFSGDFRRRRSLNILSGIITHLREDGTAASGPADYALWSMDSDPGHALDWLDYQQMYSGYAHYNRLFPVPYRSIDIDQYPCFWINGDIGQGIFGGDQIGNMLHVLDLQRMQMNEDFGTRYDYMLGIVCRDIISDRKGIPLWAGVTQDGVSAALVSVSSAATAAFDVGAIIAHELLHHYGVDNQDPSNPYVTSAELAWDSLSDDFVYEALTPMAPASELSGDGSTILSTSDYDTVYDALANPHPKRIQPRSIVLGTSPYSRPLGCGTNFNLTGRLRKNGPFALLASWVGRPDTPATIAQDQGNRLEFFGADGSKLLSWPFDLKFGLSVVGAAEPAATDGALVSVVAPFPEATTDVSLVVENSVVWRSPVPAQAPTVRLVRPTGGESYAAGATWTVEWQASHPGHLELVHTIEVSQDGGQTFLPVASGLKGSSCSWRAGLAAEGGRLLLRVVSCDGFHRVSATSGEITVTGPSRRIAIVEPARGAQLLEGRAIRLLARLRGKAGAVELDARNTEWVLDQKTSLGHGNPLQVRGCEVAGLGVLALPAGPHLLGVKVTLADGEVLEDKVAIGILADSDRDGIADFDPVDVVPGGTFQANPVVRGGDGPSSNTLHIDARGLPESARVRVRAPRHLVDQASAHTGLVPTEQSSTWTTMQMEAGQEAWISDFPLAAHEEKTIKIEVELPTDLQHGSSHTLAVSQRQSGLLVGRMGLLFHAIVVAPDWFYGNRTSRELHRYDCVFRKKMSPHHQVPFSSIDAARRQGYDGCAFCLPEHNTG